jgi:hypothetical protein
LEYNLTQEAYYQRVIHLRLTVNYPMVKNQKVIHLIRKIQIQRAIHQRLKEHFLLVYNLKQEPYYQRVVHPKQ